MDADELEMELKNKLAAKDVASVETLDKVEPLVGVEDFVSRSGVLISPPRTPVGLRQTPVDCSAAQSTS